MARFLGIDLGAKRIGLAISDVDEVIASPIVTMQACGRTEDDVRAILRVAQTHDAEAFVIGLPLNMDGSEGPQAKLTRSFGDRLASVSRRPIHYFDERLSSHAAVQLMIPAELTRKKKKARLDAVAAQVILHGFLQARRADGDHRNPNDEAMAND